MKSRRPPFSDADGCRNRFGNAGLAAALFPAVAIVIGLFGGGLSLGLLQGLGYLPAAGFDELTTAHFKKIFTDPDFFTSLGLTFYISLVSTVIAAVLGLLAALGLAYFHEKNRIVQFVFQIPLTVPHLVIAIAVMFLAAPTGLIARICQAVGLIDHSAQFPLLVNDPWGIGIMAAYVWKEVPFIAAMVLAVLKNAGFELLDAGKTLKAGRWQRFRYILLPTVSPALGAASFIVFAYTFGAFEVPFLLGRTYPMMLPVWAYKSYSDVDLLARPEGIAAGLIIALVVGVCVVCSQLLVRGATRRGAIL